MKKLRYYLFALGWLWRNRDWKGTRQKYKAMDRAFAAHEKKTPP